MVAASSSSAFSFSLFYLSASLLAFTFGLAFFLFH
jgi:hypothetical protein